MPDTSENGTPAAPAPEFVSYEPFPLLAMWPVAGEATIQMMEEDILRQGVVHDIVVWEGPRRKEYLIDGRTRQEAARRAFLRRYEETGKAEADNGLPLQPGVCKFEGTAEDVLNFIRTSNTRKDYSPGQRAAIGCQLYYYDYKKTHGDRLPSPAEEVQEGAPTSAELGRRWGCNEYYARIVRILYREAPDLLDQVANNVIPPAKAKSQLEVRKAGASADAPEPPGDPEKVKDAHGKEVPEVLTEAFKDRAGFRVVQNHLQDAIRAAEKVAARSGGKHFNSAAFVAAVEALIRSVKDAAPYEPCAKCHGHGQTGGREHKPCGGAGYLSKSVLRAARKAARSEAAARAKKSEPAPAGKEAEPAAAAE